MNEQSCHAIINIQSETLGTILQSHGEALRTANCKIEVSYNQLNIEAIDDFEFTNVPEKDAQVVSILCDILKSCIGKESKAIIKDIKKAKKVILEEAICDWSYVETCIGELAKEMSQMEQECPNVDQVEKYIFEFTYKNGVSSRKEYPVYREVL